MSQLLIGIIFLVVGIGAIVVSVPRQGKMAWFVEKPMVESLVPILFIAVCAIGVIEVIAYFTDIEVATLSGSPTPRVR